MLYKCVIVTGGLLTVTQQIFNLFLYMYVDAIHEMCDKRKL